MLEYLQREYKRTQWPFFNANKVIRMFSKEEANDLLKEGKIRNRPGLNGRLIELVITE